MTTLELSTIATILPPLLLIQGFYAGSEIALLSADKLTLRRQARSGAWGSKLALELASHPERILSSTLLMTNLTMVTVAALTALYFLGRESVHTELMAVAVASPLVVIFGELLPKTIYQRNATQLARWVAYPVQGT